MAFRIVVNGVDVFCETPEEVVALTATLNLPAKDAAVVSVESIAVPPQVPTVRVRRQRAGSLTDEARRVVGVLADADGSIDTDELAKRAGVETLRLKYAIRSIRSAAQQNGLNGDSVIKCGDTFRGRVRRTLYSIPAELRDGVVSLATP